MAQQRIDVTGGEQIQGIVPLANGGTGATSLSGAGIEQTANKNVASGYAGLNSSGYVAPGNLGSGSASASTVLAGNSSWVAPTATPTASTMAEWDANKNFSANAFIESLTPITTAGGTTTLTTASTAIQYFTGVSNQTLVLPTTGVVTGEKYRVINNSSGTITVNASAGATVVAMSANTDCAFTALAATPTTPAGWEAQYQGTAITVSSSSITLVGGNQCYVFPGSSGVTWTLPSVAGNTGSTLFLENRGTAAITVSPGGSDHIWFLSALTTFTVAAGGSLNLVNDGTYWNTLSVDLANNSVGILAKANGGTGNSTGVPADFIIVAAADSTVRAIGDGDFTLGFYVGRAFTLTSITYQFATADASGSTTVNVLRNGTAITSSSVSVTAANQADGTGTDAARTVTVSQSVSVGDRLLPSITAVGTTPGKGLRAYLFGTWN